MTMTVAEVYDARLAAGTPEDKAARAAEAIASFDSRFNKDEIEADHRVAQFRADVDQRFDEVDGRFNKVEADLELLKWMVGLVVAGIVALITKTFF